MSTSTTVIRKIISGLLLTGVALSTSPATQAKSTGSVDLYRIPEPTQRDLARIPKNLARWHMGASLVLVKDDQFQRVQVSDVGYFQESVFLSDNPALTYRIEQGPHDYIIDLGRFMRVSRFFLNNQSAEGDFTLYASDTLEDTNSGKWMTLTRPLHFTQGVIPAASFPEVETRYILVRFQIQTSGMIGNFGATGPLKITEAEFTIGKGENPDTVIKAQSPIIDYDFASTYTGTRIVYASGGPIEQIYNLLDEDPTTNYALPSTQECVLILDLRKGTEMRTFTVQCPSGVAGLAQVYMVDYLPTYFENPEKTGVATLRQADGSIVRAELAATDSDRFGYFMAAQTPHEVVRVPEDFFQDIKDSYSVHVSANQNCAALTFDDLERRYVIFRFIPDALKNTPTIQHALYQPGASDFTMQRAQASGITFGQIGVIGDVEFDDLFFTMKPEQGEPGGPPEDPPDDPPVISR